MAAMTEDAPAVDEAHLLSRWHEDGDHAALAALVESAMPYGWRVARRACASDADAEDALQEAIVALMTRSRSFDPRRPLRPWLAALIVNAARMRRRAEGTRRRHGESIAAAARQPADERPGEADEAVLAAVDRLPAHERVPVWLHAVEGLSCRDIARSLGAPEGTVRSRVARGVERLRATLVRRGFAAATLDAGFDAVRRRMPAAAAPNAVRLVAAATASAAAAAPATMSLALLSAVLVIALSIAVAAWPHRHAGGMVAGEGAAPEPDPLARALVVPLLHADLRESAAAIARGFGGAAADLPLRIVFTDACGGLPLPPREGITRGSDATSVKSILDDVARQSGVRWQRDGAIVRCWQPLDDERLARLTDEFLSGIVAGDREVNPRSVRQRAAFALAASGDPRAARPLLLSLPGGGERAREALACLAAQAGRARGIYAALADDHAVRDAVAAALVRRVDAATAASAAARAAGGAARRRDNARFEAFLTTPEHRAPAVADGDVTALDVVMLAALCVDLRATAAADALARMVADGSMPGAADLMRPLAELDPARGRAVLLGAIGDDPEVACAAAVALALSGDQTGLRRLLATDSHGSSRGQWRLGDLLEQRLTPDPEVVRESLRQAADRNQRDRRRAVLVLGMLRAHDAWDVLLEIARDRSLTSPPVGDDGLRAIAANPAGFQSSAGQSLREAAICALALMATPGEAPAIAALAHDPDRYIGLVAANDAALPITSSGWQTDLAAAIAAFLASGDTCRVDGPQVDERLVAEARSGSDWRSAFRALAPHSERVPDLLRLADDPALPVERRCAAIQALWPPRTADVEAALLRIAESVAPAPVRIAALNAGRMSVQAASCAQRIASGAGDAEVRVAACRRRGFCGSEAIQPLIDLAHDATDEPIRVAACAALSDAYDGWHQIGTLPLETDDRFAVIAATDRAVAVRAAALAVLTRERAWDARPAPLDSAIALAARPDAAAAGDAVSSLLRCWRADHPGDARCSPVIARLLAVAADHADPAVRRAAARSVAAFANAPVDEAVRGQLRALCGRESDAGVRAELAAAAGDATATGCHDGCSCGRGGCLCGDHGPCAPQ